MLRHRLRTWLILGCIILFTFVLWDLNQEGEIIHHRGGQRANESNPSELFKEHCQYLENDIEGQEGDVPEAYEIVALVLAFRHGERSPVVPIMPDAVQPDCSAYFDTHRRAFSALEQLITSQDFQTFLRIDQKFGKYPQFPDRSRCQLGRMTAEGALQLVRLGNLLRGKYFSAGLLKGLNAEDVFIISSLFPRTFQSAIAFTSSFFFPLLNSNFTSLTLKSSKNTYFCWDKECVCPALKRFRIEFELERSKNFFSNSPPVLRQRLQNLIKIVGIKVLEHPLEFVDAVLGRYACRRLPLPCDKNRECVTFEDFQDSLQEAKQIVKRLSQSTPLNSLARRLFVTESYTILRDLRNVIAKVQSGYGKQVRVYSGHDVTLEPLIFSLGLENDTQFVHYASRIAFEVYKSKRPNTDPEASVLLKIIVNGFDQTSNIGFCKPLLYGLCSALNFEKFFESAFFQMAGAKNHDDLCAH
ncbi:histidine phosphatase superfamily (branch 2) domain-containing protein [Ditylenchus destructor]|uniref:2-phosphoxylose phosphatase 1 n=1 Tax=Ditylenchus destructor TaxID=166010 RepID=A0AAD4NJE0_9BILA|nr:histidine phosphatase superfamily (branch 2) domain-containing protein [Ditylenchus destructor]